MPIIKVTSEAKQKLLLNWNAGFTTRQIAKIYGIKRRHVFNILAALGAQQRPLHKKLSAKQSDRAIHAYTAGAAPYKLAKKYQVGIRQIRNILRRRGVEMRGRSEAARKYELNEHIFDSINEHSAYWAGFIAADGCLAGRGTLNIGLAERDIGHLYKFRDFIESNQPVFTRIRKSNVINGRRIKEGLLCEIIVRSLPMVIDLRHWGIRDGKPNRSPISELTTNRHFWRGMIDGDGTFGIYQRQEGGRLRTRVSLGFAGSWEVVTSFIDFMKKHYSCLDVSPRNRGNFYSVQITNKYTHELIRILYQDASIALNRKVKIAHTILAAVPVQKYN